MPGDGNLRAERSEASEPEQVSMFSTVDEPARVGLDDEPAPPPRRRLRLRVVSQPLLPMPLDPDLAEWVQLAKDSQPRTHGECDRMVWEDDGSPAPCPFVSCKLHLWSDELEDADVDDGSGLPRRMRQFEHLIETVDPAQWGETCSLRVAKSVTLEPSETGKWIAKSSDGEVIGMPGPSFDTDRREWVAVEGEFAAPRSLDAAVIGRFLGGLSREQIRKDLNRAAARLRADAEARAWALDTGIDLDRTPEIE